MSRFLEALHAGRVLLMDGAMGTQLQRAGIQDGECYELWNLSHPVAVRAIHRSYAVAGAEVFLTHTFLANPTALVRHGAQDQLGSIVESALGNARAASGPARFVLADIGPVDGPEAVEALAPVIHALRDADGLLLETWSNPLALLVVEHTCRAVREVAGMPVLLSLTYRRHPGGALATAGGHPPEWFAMLAQQNHVAALGVNCGRDIGMEEVIEIVRRYRRVTDLPLFARPNAGTPTRDGSRWVYPVMPDQMAARMPELLEAGACMVGGCCGTTPEHIAALRPVVDAWNAARFPLPQR